MKRLLRLISRFAIATALALAAFLVSLYIDHGRDVTLPAPSGPHAVGRLTDVWTDRTHPEPFADTPDTPRELAVWIWYPAAAAPGTPPAGYLPVAWQQAFESHRPRLPNLFLSRDLTRIHSHALADAPLAADQGTYPVVILRGGLGAQITDYTTLAEDLASHGYVVTGFDAPYRTSLVLLPGGRVVTRPAAANPETVSGEAAVQLATKLLAAWTTDVGIALDRLEQLNASPQGPLHGRLNLQAIGVAGHSLGGATAAQFCHDDSRCRAGIDMDGRPLGSVAGDGLQRPFMFLLSDHAGERDAESRQITTDVQSIFDRLPTDARLLLMLRGANHFSFSDQLVTRPRPLIAAMQIAGILGLEPRRGLAVTAEYLRRFFDVHLKGAPASLVAHPDPAFPEVRFLSSAAGALAAQK